MPLTLYQSVAEHCMDTVNSYLGSSILPILPTILHNSIFRVRVNQHPERSVAARGGDNLNMHVIFLLRSAAIYTDVVMCGAAAVMGKYLISEITY